MITTIGTLPVSVGTSMLAALDHVSAALTLVLGPMSLSAADSALAELERGACILVRGEGSCCAPLLETIAEMQVVGAGREFSM